MQFNVAQLLGGPIGATRKYDLNEDIGNLDPELVATQPLAGPVHLTRTVAGVLVQGQLHTQVQLPCARCNQDTAVDVDIALEEEFLSVMDVRTGLPLPIPDDSDAFFISEQHILDLSEAVRQYIFLALPMKPLCHPDCAGLCVHCGRDLNTGPCACPTELPDERWSALTELLNQ
jgi:uncharacterized protein